MAICFWQSYDDIFEPKLDELIHQLRGIGGLLNYWLTDHLTSKLLALSSPDDLFNFFSDMRGQFILNYPFFFFADVVLYLLADTHLVSIFFFRNPWRPRSRCSGR